MYSKITNPRTGRRVSVKSRLGKTILRNYLLVLKGGASSGEDICAVCGHPFHTDKCTICGHKPTADDATMTAVAAAKSAYKPKLVDMKSEMKGIFKFLGKDEHPRHNLEIATGRAGLSHRASQRVKINLDCSDSEWAIFQEQMEGSYAKVIFIWDVPEIRQRHPDEGPIRDIGEFRSSRARVPSSVPVYPEFVVLPHIDRLEHFKDCELHINTGRIMEMFVGPNLTAPKSIKLNNIGTCSGLSKIVSINHSSAEIPLPALIFDDSVLELAGRLTLSRRKRGISLATGQPISVIGPLKMNPELLLRNSPAVLQWIISQMEGTFKINREILSMFSMGDEVVIAGDEAWRVLPVFDIKLTKMFRLLNAVLQSGPCKIIIEEPEMTIIKDMGNSRFSLRQVTSHMEEIHQFSDGDREVFNILLEYGFQYTLPYYDGSWERNQLGSYWTLDTTGLEDAERLAIARRIAERLEESSESGGGGGESGGGGEAAATK